MATYSLFDWSQGQYQIYMDNRPVPLMSDVPPPVLPRPYSRIGFDINDVLPVLPNDAVFRGMSEYAKGQIVRQQHGKAGVPANSSYTRGGGSPNLGMAGYQPVHHHHQPQMQHYQPSMPVMLPDGGMGFAPAMGQAQDAIVKLAFKDALILNVVISVVSGLITSFVYKNVFTKAAATIVAAPKVV